MQATKLLIAGCLAMTALAGAASAHGQYTVTKTAFSPGTADISGVAIIGVAACHNTAPALPLFCGTGGLGAFIDVSRDANPLTEAPLECGLQEAGVTDPACATQTEHHHHAFATGTCTVSFASGIGTDFFWSCGVDRNNDGFVTDAAVCEAEDANYSPIASTTLQEECTGGLPGSTELYADDWVDGCYRHNFVDVTPCSKTGNSDSRPFCFQDNVRGFTETTTDDTGQADGDISALNQHVSPVKHGDGWSDVVFFVGAQVPNTASVIGSLNVELKIAGASSCGGGNVSGDDAPNNHGPGNADTDNGRDTPECSDSIDNLDTGTEIDQADPHCLSGPNNTYNPDDNNESPTQCDDGIDNDDGGAGPIDEDDPDCHTDGNENNPATYDPEDNAE